MYSIQLSIEKHKVYFYILAFVNNAAVNRVMKISEILFPFPLKSHSEMRLLDHKVIFSLWGNAIFSSMEMVPIYIPNNTQGFPFLHILAKVCLSDDSHSNGCEVICCSFSRIWLFVIPWTAACQYCQWTAFHSLLEFTQTHVHWVSDAIQPSHPLSPLSPPILNLSQEQGLVQWVSSSHQVAKVLEHQLLHQSFQWIFRVDFL